MLFAKCLDFSLLCVQQQICVSYWTFIMFHLNFYSFCILLSLFYYGNPKKISLWFHTMVILPLFFVLIFFSSSFTCKNKHGKILTHTHTNCISIHANWDRSTKATAKKYTWNVYIFITAVALVVSFDALFTYLEIPTEFNHALRNVMPHVHRVEREKNKKYIYNRTTKHRFFLKCSSLKQ